MFLISGLNIKMLFLKDLKDSKEKLAELTDGGIKIHFFPGKPRFMDIWLF